MIFSKMPFVLEGLSPESMKLLDKMALYQKNMDIRNLNKESVFISHAERMLDKFKYQRHILHLKQLITERERKNLPDKKDIEKFSEQLQLMKEELNKKQSAESMQKEIATVKGKVVNYEKNISEAKKKEEKLGIKAEILPESLEALIEELESLQTERDQLKVVSDNITLARSSRNDLLKLKSATKHFHSQKFV